MGIRFKEGGRVGQEAKRKRIFYWIEAVWFLRDRETGCEPDV